jgi:hypothetical protein
MPELDAFRTNLGVTQGRVEVAPGELRFVLGDLEPGRLFDLATGEFAEVVQTADLTGVTLVRARLTLRAPAGLPAGSAWEASIVIDGAKLARTTCESGRTRTITDLAANVSKLTGAHEVGVRLELVSL